MSLVLFVYLFVFEGNMYIYIDVLIWQGLKLILAVTKWEENCIEGADFEICIFFSPLHIYSKYWQLIPVSKKWERSRANIYIYIYIATNRRIFMLIKYRARMKRWSFIAEQIIHDQGNNNNRRKIQPE